MYGAAQTNGIVSGRQAYAAAVAAASEISHGTPEPVRRRSTQPCPDQSRRHLPLHRLRSREATARQWLSGIRALLPSAGADPPSSPDGCPEQWRSRLCCCCCCSSWGQSTGSRGVRHCTLFSNKNAAPTKCAAIPIKRDRAGPRCGHRLGAAFAFLALAS